MISVFFILLSAFILSCKGHDDVVYITSYRGCVYNGAEYRNWYFLSTPCFMLFCYNNQWYFIAIRTRPSCGRCYVYGDPNFITFDGKYYNWRGICNYTLTQPFNCDDPCSYNPSYGIYGDFEVCWWWWWWWWRPSRLDCTTYKVDPHTALTILHTQLPTTVLINGNYHYVPTIPTVPTNPVTGVIFPIIMWRLGNCAYIVGIDYSIKACKHSLFSHTLTIYARDYYMTKIAGLCGLYNGDPLDDFLRRDNCEIAADVETFALTWLTLQQKDDCCPSLENGFVWINYDDKFSEKCEEYSAKGFSSCRQDKELYEETRKIVIGNCIADTSADSENPEVWLNVTYDFAYQFCESANQEKEEDAAKAVAEKLATSSSSSETGKA